MRRFLQSEDCAQPRGGAFGQSRYPGIYVRKQMLWMKYYDVDGNMVRESTGCPVGHEKAAAKARADVVAAVAKARRERDASGEKAKPVTTLAQYAEGWVAGRSFVARFGGVERDGMLLQLHVNCREVEGREVATCRWARFARGTFAISSVSSKKRRARAPHDSSRLRDASHDVRRRALDRLVITANPCELPRDALPKKSDKDPLC